MYTPKPEYRLSVNKTPYPILSIDERVRMFLSDRNVNFGQLVDPDFTPEGRYFWAQQARGMYNDVVWRKVRQDLVDRIFLKTTPEDCTWV